MEQDRQIDDQDQQSRLSLLDRRLCFWGKMYILAALIYFTINLVLYLRTDLSLPMLFVRSVGLAIVIAAFGITAHCVRTNGMLIVSVLCL